MDPAQYGPFATTVAVAAALVATFSLLLLKAVGRLTQWTWLIQDTPPFMVTVGARAVAVVLIAITYIYNDQETKLFFISIALLSGIATLYLINKFELLRRKHVCDVPLLRKDGKQVGVRKIAIGSVDTMLPQAKLAYSQLVGVSPCQFLGGFGANKLNDPAAIWSADELARISTRLTTTLMGIVLAAVLALYIAASAIEVHLRTGPSTPGAGRTIETSERLVAMNGFITTPPLAPGNP